jgi:small-conductance mechanosensitive channel
MQTGKLMPSDRRKRGNSFGGIHIPEDFASRIVAVVLMLGAWICFSSPSVAEPPSTADASAARHVPASMSAKEYDAMLDDIAETVVQRLRGTLGQGAVRPDAQASGGNVTVTVQESSGSDAFAGSEQLLNRGGEVLASLPSLNDNLAEVVRRMGGRAPGGAGRFFIWLLSGAVLAVCAEKATRRIVTRLVQQSAPETRRTLPLTARIVGRALLDASALIPLWLILDGFSFYGGTEDWLQPRVAQVIFTGVLIWRATILIPRIWFRPKDPGLRIAAIDNSDARRLYYAVSVAALFYVSAQSMYNVLVAADAPSNVIITAGFFNNLLFTIVDYTTIFVTRRATARWLTSLVNNNGSVFATIKLQLAKYWWVIGILADTVMTVALAYGQLSGNQTVGGAILTSLMLVIALIFLETLYNCMQRPVGAMIGQPADVSRERSIDLLARCLRVVTRLVILTTTLEIWIFDVLPVTSTENSALIGKEIKDTFLTITLSYLVWQIASFYIGRLLGEAGPVATGPVATGSVATGQAEQPLSAGSRLHTMLPLARTALGITIAVLATLIVLSRLGVNIAPLIAGASVLGLAVSFGSQSLVRDVVSGIFYLADDAFRVGEYIDVGKAKGMVEGFTLRSIKLRHQSGSLHTVPFGQLGHITNFSRDWTTMKFNSRFARDTDLEKLRKVVKKIGLEMMQDPEFNDELIEPLKMMGVVDIADNALVIRFKFTARPSNPSGVQRNAIKRMFQIFPEAGIEFASGTIAVQAISDRSRPPCRRSRKFSPC